METKWKKTETQVGNKWTGDTSGKHLGDKWDTNERQIGRNCWNPAGTLTIRRHVFWRLKPDCFLVLGIWHFDNALHGSIMISVYPLPFFSKMQSTQLLFHLYIDAIYQCSHPPWGIKSLDEPLLYSVTPKDCEMRNDIIGPWVGFDMCTKHKHY